ncbi:hypothetical protein L7F22_056530 [Adiantum nelumboides]|nr:hypothetical protein [Adiantum nelumboides]
MMDVLVNKRLATPLKERKEGVYKDDQWEESDARARATICLHLGESIFFTIMDKTTAFELWDSLCSAWDGKSASNKVFLMKKLMHLSMKKGSSVSSHSNEFNPLYSQLTSKGLNFDDEMKAIFLLCSLPAPWDTFNTAISNSTHGGKLAFSDVTNALLTEEIRHQSLDSGVHGDVYMEIIYALEININVPDADVTMADAVCLLQPKTSVSTYTLEMLHYAYNIDLIDIVDNANSDATSIMNSLKTANGESNPVITDKKITWHHDKDTYK